MLVCLLLQLKKNNIVFHDPLTEAYVIWKKVKTVKVDKLTPDVSRLKKMFSKSNNSRFSNYMYKIRRSA